MFKFGGGDNSKHRSLRLPKLEKNPYYDVPATDAKSVDFLHFFTRDVVVSIKFTDLLKKYAPRRHRDQEILLDEIYVADLFFEIRRTSDAKLEQVFQVDETWSADPLCAGLFVQVLDNNLFTTSRVCSIILSENGYNN